MLLLSEQGANNVDVIKCFPSVLSVPAWHKITFKFYIQNQDIHHSNRTQMILREIWQKHTFALNVISLTLMIWAPITQFKLHLQRCLWKVNKVWSIYFRDRFKSSFRDCDLHTKYQKCVRQILFMWQILESFLFPPITAIFSWTPCLHSGQIHLAKSGLNGAQQWFHRSVHPLIN